MVHLTETQSWQWTFQQLAERSRWDLPDADVERHMAVAFEYVMELLGDGDQATARRVITSYSIHYTKLYEARIGRNDYAGKRSPPQARPHP